MELWDTLNIRDLSFSGNWNFFSDCGKIKSINTPKNVDDDNNNNIVNVNNQQSQCPISNIKEIIMFDKFLSWFQFQPELTFTNRFIVDSWISNSEIFDQPKTDKNQTVFIKNELDETLKNWLKMLFDHTC